MLRLLAVSSPSLVAMHLPTSALAQQCQSGRRGGGRRQCSAHSHSRRQASAHSPGAARCNRRKRRHGIQNHAGCANDYLKELVPEPCVAHGRGRPGTWLCIVEVREHAYCAQGPAGGRSRARRGRPGRARVHTRGGVGGPSCSAPVSVKSAPSHWPAWQAAAIGWPA